EDKWKVITEKRNRLELSLRKVVKLTIKLMFGSIKGKDEFLKIIGSNEKRKEKLSALSFDELFSDGAEIYFEDLRKYISNNWVDFQKIFNDKQLFDIYMPVINKYRID